MSERAAQENEPPGPLDHVVPDDRSAMMRSMTRRISSSSSSVVARYTSNSAPMGSLIGRTDAPYDAKSERRNPLPLPPSASMRSRWCGPMARMRSDSRTRSRLSDWARWLLRSMLRSMPTSNDPSDAGAPSHALVPALATSTSDSPRSML